jgi:23S rRNA (cytidine1920-2'-O)/16S rRNA (cytidine1409-2'-O)-methyltransferase
MRLDRAVSQIAGVSRNRAQFFIEHGLVQVAGVIATKASADIASIELVTLLEHPQRSYVSRSAQKLDDALEFFRLSVEGIRCLDVGSSTGGFTQVLLARGASHIVAVEAGSDQLHPTLRSDQRIELHESTDIRVYALRNPGQFDRIVVDVSFIPLSEVFPTLVTLVAPLGAMVILFKPQFEVASSDLTGSGVARDEPRDRAIDRFLELISNY